jgi:F-type H+-transporting ATPase subunit epsilon
MRLVVTTPFAILAEAEGIVHLRAENTTGPFGILPGHADFLTVLVPSVVSWRDEQGAERSIAVCGGVLEVSGDLIAIATPEAVPGDDGHRLETEVIARLMRRQEEDQDPRADAQRLYVETLRRVVRFLRARSPRPAPGGRFGPDDGIDT